MPGVETSASPIAERAIKFRLNGRETFVEGQPGHTTLLDYLRESGLTGAKEGCAEGECGACTVLLVAADGDLSAYRTANSCLMLLPAVDGHEVYTVESLAEGGRLCEVQEAMASGGGSQCGYCTPGFVMSLFAEQYRVGRTGPCDTNAMTGNLCRCTGYRPIQAAARKLGPPPAGAFLDRLAHPAPRLSEYAYTTPRGRFSRPATVDQCLALLAGDPNARVIAGGTDLAVEANLRGSRWQHLVSVEAIDELRSFQLTAAEVRIGAALPLSELMMRWADMPEAFRHCLESFASTTIRNRATLGGNLANASPIGDCAPVLLALDAQLDTAGPRGRRSLRLQRFFTGYRKTELLPQEIITAVRIPPPEPGELRFFKVSKRRVDDISTVSAAIGLRRNSAGEVTEARFAFGGAAASPIRVHAAERAAVGTTFDRETVSRLQEAIAGELKPLSDHRGSAEYRLALAQSLVEKFWWEVVRQQHV